MCCLVHLTCFGVHPLSSDESVSSNESGVPSLVTRRFTFSSESSGPPSLVTRPDDQDSSDDDTHSSSSGHDSFRLAAFLNLRRVSTNNGHRGNDPSSDVIRVIRDIRNFHLTDDGEPHDPVFSTLLMCQPKLMLLIRFVCKLDDTSPTTSWYIHRLIVCLFFSLNVPPLVQNNMLNFLRSSLQTSSIGHKNCHTIQSRSTTPARLYPPISFC